MVAEKGNATNERYQGITCHHCHRTISSDTDAEQWQITPTGRVYCGRCFQTRYQPRKRWMAYEIEPRPRGTRDNNKGRKN